MRIPRRLDRLAGRIRPLVPDGAWPLLRTAMSFAEPGPLIGLPALRRVVVIAPHPDDETLGAGATLALLAQGGARVTVVVLTDGERTPGTGLESREIAERRRAETVEACALLGLDPPRFLGHPDGELSGLVPVLGGMLAGTIVELAPDAVFLPWFGESIPDHRAPSAALARAATPGRVQVWGYEIWSPLPANRLVDVSSTMSRKEQAVTAHRTAHGAFDLAAVLGLNRYRSVHGLAGRGWAEAFLVAPADRYVQLATTFGGMGASRNISP